MGQRGGRAAAHIRALRHARQIRRPCPPRAQPRPAAGQQLAPVNACMMRAALTQTCRLPKAVKSSAAPVKKCIVERVMKGPVPNQAPPGEANIMALAPQAGRFAYLPISMPSLSGSAARRGGAAPSSMPGSGAGTQHSLSMVTPKSCRRGAHNQRMCCFCPPKRVAPCAVQGQGRSWRTTTHSAISSLQAAATARAPEAPPSRPRSRPLRRPSRRAAAPLHACTRGALPFPLCCVVFITCSWTESVEVQCLIA